MSRKVLAIIVAGFSVSLALVIVFAADRNQLDHSEQVVGQGEAQGVLNEAVRLAQAGDYAGLCQSVAATPRMCITQTEGAVELGHLPGAEPPRVVAALHFNGSAHTPPMMVLTIEGTLADGSRFDSEFGVIRAGENKLRSITAPYWAGIDIHPHVKCEIRDDPEFACAESRPN